MGILSDLIAGRAIRRFLFSLVLWLVAGAAAASCSVERLDLRGEFGTVRFQAELALTPEEHARGLMFREEMARLSSMLFVFPQPRERTFWMRNTLIPLDIIFLDDSGTITRIHENAVPLDETVIPSNGPARAVLEINGGLAADLGLAVGDELRSPVMPQDLAAWPCD
ncbi:MAG: DUF192 domain-containing protein [Pseudomonadota bacterium]